MIIVSDVCAAAYLSESFVLLPALW